jgi:hypothetical protein
MSAGDVPDVLPGNHRVHQPEHAGLDRFAELRVGTPDQERRTFDDDEQRERREDGGRVRDRLPRPGREVDDPLGGGAHHGRRQDAERERGCHRKLQLHGERHEQEAADQRVSALRDVQDARAHADDAKAKAQERIDAPLGQAGDQNLGELSHRINLTGCFLLS